MDANNNKEPVCPYADSQYCAQPSDDEINLLDIWMGLWSQRFFIMAVTMIVVCFSLPFAFFAKEVYIAKAEIVPFDNFQTAIVQELQEIPYGFKFPSSEEVFLSFYNNMTSFEVQNQYWREIVLAGKLIEKKATGKIHSISNEEFMRNLEIKAPKVKSLKGQPVTVILSGYDPEITSALLDTFVSYVNKMTTQGIVENLGVQLESGKLQLQTNIEIQRDLIKQKRLASIAELNEAIMIAEKLGLHDPPENAVEFPLYARGVKSLLLEREALQKREKNGEFNEELFVMESKLGNMGKIDIDLTDISTFQANTVPPQKKSQHPLMIVFLGVFLGLAVALFMAFVRNFLRQAKKNAEEGNALR